MTEGWVGIAVVAFSAQLAVLPGEKVQLIIASLSTKYRPLVVVSAAGTAFAGWTALEIVFGTAIKRTFPPLVLEGFTAAMFLAFAVLLYASIPERGAETDGAGYGNLNVTVPVVGHKVPKYLGGFLPIFIMMAVGEFGDKTQLITITLAANHGPHPAIWFGEMAAIIPVSILNSLFFYRFSELFDARKAHIGGAFIFLFFALDTVLGLTVGFSFWERFIGYVTSLV